MTSRFWINILLIIGILLTFITVLLSGCMGNNSTIAPVNNTVNGQQVPPTQMTTIITKIPDATPVTANVTGNVSSKTVSQPDITVRWQDHRADLDDAWTELRIINTETTGHYLSLDLSKDDDINYFRYTLIPDTVEKITGVRGDLLALKLLGPDQENETHTLIEITNYTILKYQGISLMLHARQYSAMRDPVNLKNNLMNAKLTIMSALDIINTRDIAAYPSKYRDQISADKREMEDMVTQIDEYTRTVYAG